MGKEREVTEEKVGPTEEVVQALLECMVEPLLLLGRNKSKQVPSLDQQLSIAKQVHAVVLLYNYYYRKQHPAHKLEFLNFISFCQLAVVLQPSLMTYMKLMHRSDYKDVDNLESQLSLTEKAIMSACDISSSLDAAAEIVPLSEKWPITKVAVFLVDSRRENCLLVHNSMAVAALSIIEKYLDDSSDHLFDSECKKKRATNTFSPGLQYADGARLEELALSAAIEETGINRSDLVVLESHLVYSLDKEKAAARLYLVQFNKSVYEDAMVPIEDVIESLQGPLIKKNPSGWTVSRAVEYFHLLPYGEILSNWHSRGMQEEVSAVGLSLLGSQQSEDPVTTLASKEHAISQSALAVLRWKREKLCNQLRTLEDEIALCDKTIRKALNGGEDDLPLKIEALVDSCNDICVNSEGVKESTNQLVENQCFLQYSKGKRSSEPINSQDQCQQLDQFCCRNNWVLPTYRVFPFEGGFFATVIVKGADFEFTSQSDICGSPHEARECAAAQMIAKVAGIAGLGQ